MVPNIAKMALKVGLFKKQGQVITIKAFRTKWKWNKSNVENKNKPKAKEPTRKKVKRDLLKVKCFNCDLHGHLVKDYSKPLWVIKVSTQGWKILQGGLEAKVNALGEISQLIESILCD